MQHFAGNIYTCLLYTSWAPNQDLYGIFPMIIASILVTGGAILIGVPLGLLLSLIHI